MVGRAGTRGSQTDEDTPRSSVYVGTRAQPKPMAVSLVKLHLHATCVKEILGTIGIRQAPIPGPQGFGVPHPWACSAVSTQLVGTQVRHLYRSGTAHPHT